MTSNKHDQLNARSLPDEYARLRAPAGRRVLELVARRWGDRQEGERRQLAQVLVTILEPLNRPDAEITDDLRNACEQAVASWVQSTVPVADLVTAPASAPEGAGRRLIRLVTAHMAREEDGQWWARVTLERTDGGRYSVRTPCRPDAPRDQIRAAAEATVQALRQAVTARDLQLHVRETGTFGAFDTTGVIVAVAVSHAGQDWTGIGVCSDMANDPVRAAAVAVLNATNRRLGTG